MRSNGNQMPAASLHRSPRNPIAALQGARAVERKVEEDWQQNGRVAEPV